MRQLNVSGTNRTEAVVTPRLELARSLVRALEAGDDAGADAIVRHLNHGTETSLFKKLGELTRELHDVLSSVERDSRITEIAQSDVVDAKERLHYVITKTDEAVHRTLDAVEKLFPITERIGKDVSRLMDDSTRIKSKEASDKDLKKYGRDVTKFLKSLGTDTDSLKKCLSDVVLAQSYQDLTGQVIRRVIEIVQEIEERLVGLVVASSGQAANAAVPGKDIVAEGPQINTNNNKQVLAHQDDVDSLLSSLGF
jgi:chemotaxis protein CheZ